MTRRKRDDLTGLFNEFDRLFGELKRRCGNDASRIDWLVRNSDEVRVIVGKLYYWQLAFESEVARRRSVTNVPDWFISRYKDYRASFGTIVDDVYGFLVLRALVEKSVDGIPATEIRHPGGETGLHAPPHTWVLPGTGAEAVDLVFTWTWNMHEDSIHSEDLREGLEAWEWFHSTVGIDLEKIEQRWNDLPRTLVPSEITGEHPRDGVNGILDLLEEAAKAYVFGLPAAAVAMCRAVCEQVLRRYYSVSEDPDTTLGKLAMLAERRYAHVRRTNLRQHIRQANRVMHDFKGGSLPEEELKVVRQFLETTKALIEGAPEQTREAR